MEERIFTAGLIVIPIDDYTDKIIIGTQVSITLNGEKPQIIKSEGYHVFGKIPGISLLEVKGNHYQHREETIKKEDIPGQILYLRLLPREGYITGKAPTEIMGKGILGKSVKLAFHNPVRPYRMLAAQKDRAAVRMYHQTDSFLEGKWFEVEGEGMRGKFCIRMGLDGAEEKRNTWMTDRVIPFPLNPHSSLVKRIYRVPVNEKGDFYFLVPEEYAEAGTVEITTGTSAKTVTFLKGKQNMVREEY